MAAPKDSPEDAFRLRKFQGTNTEIDSTFLGPSFVAASENWIPTQSFRLGKRPGSTYLQAIGGSVTGISDLLVARDASHAYLFAYIQRTGSGVFDFVSVIVDEGAPGWDPPFAFFSQQSLQGRMIQFRNRIYCGNGVDPIFTWTLGGQAIALGAITNLGDPPVPVAVAVNAASSAARLTPGTYQYCWAIFDPATGLYTGRTTAKSVVVTADQTLNFPVLAMTLNTVQRLFVSIRGYPIEYATMQGQLDIGGVAPAATPINVSAVDVTDTPCPTIGITRTGNMFVVWRNKLIFSGMASDPYSVFATDTILPGLEQATFNQGTFFPVGAKVPLPAVVTGIGVAGVTSDMDAQSPLLFFTLTKTFLCQGDPFSKNDEAQLVEVSSRVGCIGHDSIVNTPVGTLFCGLDSVYLIPPGGGYPQDVGWPIADQIRSIPPGLRSKITAVFHKQFYKLAIPESGGALNTNQWWLDLRQGVGDTPSWWGPHRGLTVSAMATDIANASEVDRGYAAQADINAGNVAIVRMHQVDNYTDFNPVTGVQDPIVSRLRSGRFDADQPFLVKVFTRIRLIAQTLSKSAIQVDMQTDGGVNWTLDDILLGQDMDDPGEFVHLTPSPPVPVNRAWNTARFGSINPVEVQTIAPFTRPRGLSVVVTLTHGPKPEDTNPTTRVGGVEIRDFEVLFLISERKVRYIGYTSGGRAQRPERISK